jgi:hypothetical protein
MTRAQGADNVSLLLRISEILVIIVPNLRLVLLSRLLCVIIKQALNSLFIMMVRTMSFAVRHLFSQVLGKAQKVMTATMYFLAFGERRQCLRSDTVANGRHLARAVEVDAHVQG